MEQPPILSKFPLLCSSMDSPISSFLLFFVFSLPFVFGNSLDLYSSCSNLFNCGDITNVGFPFWGVGRPHDCGNPALQLACEGNKTTIVIMEIKYQILKYSLQNNSQTLTIARTDYMGTLCPKKFINTTIDYNLFEAIPTYGNITLLYCSSSTAAGQFSCPEYNAGFIQVNPMELSPCNVSVIVPVSMNFFPPVSDVVNSTEVLKAIDEGFEVRLKEDGGRCEICKQSRGVCGYDLSSNRTTCYCRGGESIDNGGCMNLEAGGAPSSPPGDRDGNRNLKVVIGVCVGLGSAIAILFCIMTIYIRRRQRLSTKTSSVSSRKKYGIESIINYGPKRYHYSEIKKMTNSFSTKIGEGGFGIVYQGKLLDGTLVAIKVLKVSKANGEDFINEVMSISRTSHVNIVGLLGFCYTSRKAALVYELMANGSLDRFMSRSYNHEIKIIHRIVTGVARGLEYLHWGCSTRIVHFDIKPQNILLDEDLNPKISDFGLAKLCKRKVSAISMLGTRGTAGFIAPEVFSRAFGIVSYKSDVYSYGMLVLDLILGGIRNNPNHSKLLSNDDSEMYFPNWVFKNIETGKSIRMRQSLMEENEEEMEKKMTMIGLWCIQTSPIDRPTMSRVLEMLEGSIHSLQMPPRPLLVAPNMATQQSTSESLSYI